MPMPSESLSQPNSQPNSQPRGHKRASVSQGSSSSQDSLSETKRLKHSFAVLPSEALLNIFIHCDPATQRNLRLCSHAFEIVSASAWWGKASPSRLAANLPTQNKLKIASLANRIHHVRRLNISNGDSDLDAIRALGGILLLASAESLVQINIMLASESQQNTQLSQLAPTLTNLVDPQLLISALTGISRSAPESLTTLSLRGKPITDARLSLLLSSFPPTITTLKLTCPSVSETGLTASLSSLPHLTSLTLTGGTKISESLVTSLSALQLKTLSLFPKSPIQSSCFSTQLSPTAFSTLESLAFDADPSTDWTPALKNLAAVLSRNGTIKDLAIAGDAVVSAPAFLALTRVCGASLLKLKLHEFGEGMDAKVWFEGMKALRGVEEVQVSFAEEDVRAVGNRRVSGGSVVGSKVLGITPVMGVALAKWCKALRSLRINCGEEETANEMGEMVMEVYREVKKEFY
ncbi:hypothetical protein HDU98_008087 [Podochytrium sp. JEL0797]|nr:hypothetical protein HDU98_008087 [Podochytrium sp. JEL0797]